jgi:predicted MFS family arabinose efflux permease
MNAAAETHEFRRGWMPLLASAVGIGFGLTGLTFYTFGVFVIPLSEAFGWTRGETARASSFLIIGTAITAPIIGTIIDRYGARRVGLISMFGVILGYLALSQMSATIAVFYVTWFLMSLAGGGTTPVVWTRAVNMWFDKWRGLALGLALAGSGVAGILGPAFCTRLIREYGWQGAYVGLAVATLVIAVPVIAFLFRERQVASGHAAASAALPGLTVQEAIRTVDFWKIAGGFFLVSAVIAALLVNLVPLLRDRGMTPEDAAALAGVMGFAVVVGRIGVGYLVDRFRGPAVARVLLLTTSAGCFLLTIEGAPTWVAVISVMSIGFAAAAEVDLVAFLSSRYFGMKAYGKIYGLQITSFYIGAALGPLATGAAYDAFGSYLQALYFAVAALVFGAIVVGSMGRAPDFGLPAH